MVGAGEIRLTVNFLLCLFVSDPAAKRLTRMSRGKAEAAPLDLPALASDPLARPSRYKCFPSPLTAQPVNLPIQRFPLSQEKLIPLPLGPVSECHFSLNFTASLQPGNKAHVEAVLSPFPTCRLLWRMGD